MKSVMRWGFFIAGLGILFLFLYYFFFPFWPLHPSFGWRYSHFGPKAFPFFPFLVLAVMFAAGFLIFNFLFRTKGPTVSKEGKWPFCPFCGNDLRQDEPTSEVSTEAVQSVRLKQRRRKMQPCRRHEESVILFSHQELGRKKALTLRRHLSQCERCRGYLDELDHVSHVIKSHYGSPSDLFLDIQW